MQIGTALPESYIGTIVCSKDSDSRTEMHVFSLLQTTVLQILRKEFELTFENCNENTENKWRKRFRGSGLWQRSGRSKGDLIFSVDVGCDCEHDCCGHLCGLYISVGVVNNLCCVVVTANYNH